MNNNDEKVIFDAKFDETGAEIKIGKKNHASKKKTLSKIANMIDSCGFIISVILYVVLGACLNLWNCAWVLFFVPDIVSSILRAIAKKNLNLVNICFISCFAYFFVCMWVPGLKANIWHPMWVVFLLIPMYYIIVHQIEDFKKD